jgi:hypothetical protein
MTHGTAGGYVEGCRCDDCTKAHRIAARDYRRRKAEVSVLETSDPGPVESAVAAELGSLRVAADRPGVAAAVLALGRVLDGPQAAHAKPSAARVLGALLDGLHSAPVPGRRSKLALVRQMSTGGGRSRA